jgi:hypothetical protein
LHHGPVGSDVRDYRKSEGGCEDYLFNPVDGLVTRAYPTRQARAAYVKTEEYRKIRQLVTDAIERQGVVEGATPRKSGRFVVRLPQSLHAALEREAVSEGISLNHLVVAKLAIGLGRLTDLALASSQKNPQESASS